MTPHMVSYTVKPEHAARNEELLQAVLVELAAVRPPGVRFAAFKLDDGVSFTHLILVDDEHEKNPLAQLQSLRAFHAGIRERCDAPPVRTKLSEVGSFPSALPPR